MPKIFEDTIVVVTGGGGGPAPTVAVGPNFGDPGKPQVNAAITLPTIQLFGNLGVGGHITLPTVALSGGLLGIGSHIDGALALTLPTSLNAGAHISGAFGVSPPTLGIGQHIGGNGSSLALSVLGNGCGAKIGGSMLGAPSYQSITSTNGTAPATSVTINAPASLAEGDLMVAIIGHSNTTADTAPSGWTQILQQTQSGSFNCHISAWWKIATASEASTYNFAWGAASNNFWGAIIRLTATDPTTPVNTFGSTPSSVADPIAPALTTTAANCFLIAACVQVSNIDLTYTAPSGYVERAELDGATTGAVHALDGTVDTKIQAASGSVAAATMNSSTLVAVDSIAIHIAIAPGSISIG